MEDNKFRNDDGKKFTITFAGDTSLGDYYLGKQKYKTIGERLNKDPFSFFSEINPLVKNSDHLIVNLETVLADRPTNSIKGKKYPNWDNPTRTISMLKKLGVTAVSLANNHAMDFGPEVMLATKNKLEKYGIKVFGAGYNLEEASQSLEFKLAGKQNLMKVYVISCMLGSERYREYNFFAEKSRPGVNALEIKNIVKAISKLRRQKPDNIIIIFPHWQGIDYKWVSPKIEAISRRLINAGANYVFAHGTHSVNHIEEMKNGMIAYSIGNFVFNSPGRYNKFGTLPYSFVVCLEFLECDQDWTIKEKFYPILSDNKITSFKPRPISKKEAEELYMLINHKGTENNCSSLRLRKDRYGYYYLAREKQTILRIIR